MSVSLHRIGHQKYPSDRDYLRWCSDYISEPILYYFYSSKEVESVLLFYQNCFTHKYLYRMCGFLTPLHIFDQQDEGDEVKMTGNKISPLFSPLIINPVTRISVWSVCFCRPRNVETSLNVETFQSKTQCFPNPNRSISTALPQRVTEKGIWRTVKFQHRCGHTLLIRATRSSQTAAGLCVQSLDKQRETKIERKSDTACACVCQTFPHWNPIIVWERSNTHTRTRTHTDTHTHTHTDWSGYLFTPANLFAIQGFNEGITV